MANAEKVMLVIGSARPSFRNNHEKVAFAVHASFFASGFILTATGRSALAEDALSSSSNQDSVGIDGWNEFAGKYAFVYRHREKKYLVKCLVVDDDKLMVSAMNDGGAESARLEIEVGNYAEETRKGDYEGQFKNLDKLVRDLQTQIIHNPTFSSSCTKSSDANLEPRYFGGRGPSGLVGRGNHLPIPIPPWFPSTEPVLGPIGPLPCYERRRPFLGPLEPSPKSAWYSHR